MKKLLTALVGLGLVLLMDCQDCSCSDNPCYGQLKVKVTINDENPEVLLTIFEGKIERKDTVLSEWVAKSTVNFDLEADVYYSATVMYKQGVRQILAIDGKEMPISEDDSNCEYGQDTTLNLKLAD